MDTNDKHHPSRPAAIEVAAPCLPLVSSLAYRAGRVQQARLAPPLSPADQRQGLPALKADLLSQIKAQETSLLKQAGPRVPTEVLIKDSLRVLLLAPLIAIAFAVSARCSTPPPRPDPVLPRGVACRRPTATGG